MSLDWSIHNSVRYTVERYYQRNSAANNINIPKYDQFVTQTRKDWENAGFDLTSEADLFKLWGALQVTCAAAAYLVGHELENLEQVKGAMMVMGPYGNMTGLFLREMTKNCPEIPAIVTPTAGDNVDHDA